MSNEKAEPVHPNIDKLAQFISHFSDKKQAEKVVMDLILEKHFQARLKQL